MVIDFAADDQAIGIEITAPDLLSLHELNSVLEQLGHAPATEADLAPVVAA